jgi:hypothetical protein
MQPQYNAPLHLVIFYLSFVSQFRSFTLGSLPDFPWLVPVPPIEHCTLHILFKWSVYSPVSPSIIGSERHLSCHHNFLSSWPKKSRVIAHKCVMSWSKPIVLAWEGREMERQCHIHGHYTHLGSCKTWATMTVWWAIARPKRFWRSHVGRGKGGSEGGGTEDNGPDPLNSIHQKLPDQK